MVKIHVEVFIASQMLEKQQGTFSVEELKRFIKREFNDERPGVSTHISAHCVANAPLNTAHAYNYLWRLAANELRSFHAGRDTPVAARLGLASQPEVADVPTKYRHLMR